MKNKLIKNILFFEKASYICSRIQGIPEDALKESWQSGRMRQSWKLLRVTPPGVRIPYSPQKETHNESCGFFVFWSERSLLQWNGRKQKTQRALLFGISMLVLDIHLGSTKLILKLTSVKRKETKNTKGFALWDFYACTGYPFGITSRAINPLKF